MAAKAAHPAPTRPFEHVMMDFIELKLPAGKKYCLVMVDMWSKWVEAFPSATQSANDVAKALLTEIIPRWGIPDKISSDNGTHFANEALGQIGKLFGIDLRKHCAYHPASGGAIERENGTLKSKLAKGCADTGLPWPKALPIVLMYMRMRRLARANLSPSEVLFAAPPQIGMTTGGKALPSTALCEVTIVTYCSNLASALVDVRRQVSAALPQAATGPLHCLKPGDYVLVKDLRRKNWRASRWLGPFQVLLVTQTVKVAERATWIHVSHCKRVVAGELTRALQREQESHGPDHHLPL